MKRILSALTASIALAASAYEFEEEKDIRYSDASPNCILDVKWPKGVTNFATMVYFHGGGLVGDGKSYAPWPQEAKDRDPVAQVGCRYRVFAKDPEKNTTRPEDCLDDAAAATSWVLKNIAGYGGDPKKVFVSGVSAGGYQTAMIGMDPKWLAKYGYKTTDLCGIAPFTGQVTKHFNVRAIGFKDADPRYAPKIDEWAPLFWCKEKAFPPICLVTGGRHDNEMPCRVEENEFLAISLKKCGVRNVEFHETEGSHGGGVAPSAYFVRDFMAKTCDCGMTGRFAGGERVVFVGLRGDGLVAVALQLYQDLRHPGSNVRVMAADAAVALRLKPGRVFIAPDAGDDRAEALRKQVDAFVAKGVKIVLVTPPSGDATAERCAEAVRALATERHFGLVDLHRAQTADDLLAAACILDEMHVAPTVAQVSIDAVKGRAWPRANKEKKPATENAVVRAIRRLPQGGLAFTYAPKALPLPEVDGYAELEQAYPLTERFNRETFVIEGLAAGDYAVAFDGETVGSFSAADLAKGVNVARLDTPNQRRARAAAELARRLLALAGRTGSEASDAEEDDLRERLDAVRPAVSRVTVVRK